MNFKRIASVILSTALINPVGNAYAAQNPSDAVEHINNNRKISKKSKDHSVKKDPVYKAILAGGVACLCYGIGKDIYQAKNELPNADWATRIDFVGFDWASFAHTCRSYAHLITANTNIPNFILTFYEQHIRPYTQYGNLNLSNFKQHIINNRIPRRRLVIWEELVSGIFLHVMYYQIRNLGANHPRNNGLPEINYEIKPELSNFNIGRFKSAILKCLDLGNIGRERYLTPDNIDFFRKFAENIDVTCFVNSDSRIQLSYLSRHMDQNELSKEQIEAWIENVMTSIPESPSISNDNNGYRSRFKDELSNISFNSGNSGEKLNFKVNDDFLNCNRTSGWRMTPLNHQDISEDVIERRISTIFGNGRLPYTSKSFCFYVFGRNPFGGGNSRFVTLQQHDPRKIELFARILKILSELNHETISESFKPIIDDLKNMCANEFSQCIDNLALMLDQVVSNSEPKTNEKSISEVLVENAITNAKRTSLKQTANRIVEDYCNADVLTAEFQKNLYALLAPIFGLNDSMPFNRDGYHGRTFLNYLTSRSPNVPFMSLCDHFFKDCFEGIGSNITDYLNDLSLDATEEVYNQLSDVEITYNDFKKILQSSHVSNRINVSKTKFLKDVSQESFDTNFDTRFDSFIGSLDDKEDADDKKLLTDWKNGTSTPKFKEIVRTIGEYIGLSDEAKNLYELNMFSGGFGTNSGKAWMGDILIYVYLHSKGIISIDQQRR